MCNDKQAHVIWNSGCGDDIYNSIANWICVNGNDTPFTAKVTTYT